MSHKFRDVRDRIEEIHGRRAARQYEQDVQSDGHSMYDRVHSKYDAMDGASFPGNRYAKEAFEDIEQDYETCSICGYAYKIKYADCPECSEN